MGYAFRTFRARMDRPVLMVLGGISAWVVLFSLAITDLTYGLTQINATGRNEVEVFLVRVFSYPVSLAVIWLKWKNDRMNKKEHGLMVGEATMTGTITIHAVEGLE